jgi:hypothetical protein
MLTEQFGSVGLTFWKLNIRGLRVVRDLPVQPKTSSNPAPNRYDDWQDVPPISNVRSLPGAGLRNVARRSQ